MTGGLASGVPGGAGPRTDDPLMVVKTDLVREPQTHFISRLRSPQSTDLKWKSVASYRSLCQGFVRIDETRMTVWETQRD